MKRDLPPLLQSPVTGHGLRMEEYVSQGDEVIEGRLVDEASGDWFRVENGIADLSPLELRRAEMYATFLARHGLKDDGSRAANNAEVKGYTDQIRFFGRYHDEYEDDVANSPFYRILDRVTVDGWIRRELSPGSVVVEIGCGSGRQTLALAEHGCRVIAMDLSEEMLAIARRKVPAAEAGGRADFLVASADKLPVRSGIGDAAVIISSLHHFADPEAAIREASRVLKPGGRFYMLEPHDSALRPVFELSMKLWTLWQEEAADEPLFNEEQWRGWLTGCGIEPKFGYSTYLPPHVFYAVRGRAGEALLAWSDRFLSSLPGIRKLAGIIMAEGVRRG